MAVQPLRAFLALSTSKYHVGGRSLQPLDPIQLGPSEQPDYFTITLTALMEDLLDSLEGLGLAKEG